MSALVINIVKDKQYCILTHLLCVHYISCNYLSYNYSLRCSCMCIFKYFLFCDWLKVRIGMHVMQVTIL